MNIAKTAPHYNNAGTIDGVTFSFSNGISESVLFDRIGPNCLLMATFMGVKEKCRDVFANAESVDEAIARFLAKRDDLENDAWNARGNIDADLVRALVELTGLDSNECHAKIAGMTKEAVKVVRDDPRVAILLLKYKREAAERALNSIASDDHEFDLMAFMQK